MRKALRITGWILLALVAGATIAWFGFLRPEPPPKHTEAPSLRWPHMFKSWFQYPQGNK